MKNPKEKALSIYGKHLESLQNHNVYQGVIVFITAKKQALITASELQEDCKRDLMKFKYFEEVKREIEKL
jgi:hypothetical protein